MSSEEIAALEHLIGDFLTKLGYSLGSEAKTGSLRAARLRSTYMTMFEAKHRMRSTPFGRFVRLGRIELEPPTPA